MPKTAEFSDEDQGEDAPFISPDGNKLFFLSQRPVKSNPLPFPYVEKIWVMEKNKNGWSKPKKLPEIVNSTDGIHWQISVDKIGNLYFGAGGSIYCSVYKSGEYEKPIILDSTVNNKKVGNFSPYISPDGSYLIFSREVPYFTYQLFISYKIIDGTWSEAFNLSNYLKHEYSLNPRVTPDGKYFFFTGGRLGTTYWMDASFIEELRPKE
jgi:Tol biopolymer transport system component